MLFSEIEILCKLLHSVGLALNSCPVPVDKSVFKLPQLNGFYIFFVVIFAYSHLFPEVFLLHYVYVPFAILGWELWKNQTSSEIAKEQHTNQWTVLPSFWLVSENYFNSQNCKEEEVIHFCIEFQEAHLSCDKL